MIKLSAQHRIVVTGAGGWLGTELLELLLAQHGADAVRDHVICFGSRARDVTLSDGTSVRIHRLGDFPPMTDVGGVVHLAFLTRDKVAVLGTEAYTFGNTVITSQAIKLIETVNPAWIATVSSGAILSSPGGPLENDVQANPYGFTKRVEETMLEAVANSQDISLSIGRLWGAMGASMPINRNYAVSDFIMQAVETHGIAIRSGHKVWRRYCDARDFMHVLVAAAQTKKSTRFDSGGTLIEVGDLAALIASQLGTDQSCISRAQPTGQLDDEYYPDDTDYRALLSLTDVAETPASSMITHTIENHIRQRNLSA